MNPSNTGSLVIEPTPEEIAKVDAWREHLRQQAAERAKMERKYHRCSRHGPGATGRMIYGPAPYGYGDTCRYCRREWSKQNGGQRWYSDAENKERRRAAHAALVAGINAMPPAEFYVEWEALRAKRIEATKRYRYEYTPDEFGVVQQYGGATEDGVRYSVMRDRVRREREANEGRRRLEALVGA